MAKRGHIFNSVKLTRPKRSTFNLSYENKLSCNMGTLVPFFVQEVMPSDKLKVGMDYIMRAQPMLAPLMHRVNVYQHYFFIPYRLIWKDFETFITGGEDGTATATMPNITTHTYASWSDTEKRLLDYLGYPVDIQAGEYGTYVNVPVSTLRLRAYNRVWNEFFRDQNTMGKTYNSDASVIDTKNVYQNYDLLPVCWKKDYFTSALPTPQRYPYQVNIPFEGGELIFDNTKEQLVRPSNSSTALPYSNMVLQGGSQVDASGRYLVAHDEDNSVTNRANIDPNGSLYNSPLQINIEDLRKSNAIQRFLERNSLSGGRYVEQILAHFGIHTKDYRLDRPEYLGGAMQPLSISEVVQNSATSSESDTPQGNLAGKGIASGSTFMFNHTFDEHGIVLGLLSVVPTASYSQGINRHLLKFDKYDFAFPEFAHLGEQVIEQQEVYFDGLKHSGEDDTKDVFGYQSRYAEYKYNQDEIHGDFRSSLAYWHLGRTFSDVPKLNADFLLCHPRKDVFAVTTQNADCLLFDIYNVVQASRPLPTYGTPTL